MKAFDLSRYLFLLPEGVPKVGRDYCFCSLILWYILCGCELWADNSHCGLHCLGLVELWKLSERSCSFLYLKSSSFNKVYKQEIQSSRLLCIWFPILIPIFCLEMHSSPGKYLMHCKCIYRVVLLLKLGRIEWDRGRGIANLTSEQGAIENYHWVVM